MQQINWFYALLDFILIGAMFVLTQSFDSHIRKRRLVGVIEIKINLGQITLIYIEIGFQ